MLCPRHAWLSVRGATLLFPNRPCCASSPGAESSGCTLGEGALAARARLVLSPWPQRAHLCGSASAIDSPLPISGRWQRSQENRRGRGGPGNPRPAVQREAFKPCLSPAGAFALGLGAHSPARLAFLFLFYVSLISTFSVGTTRYLFIFCLFAVSLPPLLVLSPLGHSFCLSASVSVSLSPQPPLGTPLPPPSQLTTAGSTPVPREVA